MGKILREPPLTQKENNDLYLPILMKALQRSDIPEEFCSIGEYAEEAVCLERHDLSWVVYDGERGKKYNIKTYRNCKEACYDLMSRVAESDEAEKEMKDFFNMECEKIHFQGLGYKNYKKSDNNSDIVPIMGTDEFKPRADTAIH